MHEKSRGLSNNGYKTVRSPNPASHLSISQDLRQDGSLETISVGASLLPGKFRLYCKRQEYHNLLYHIKTCFKVTPFFMKSSRIPIHVHPPFEDIEAFRGFSKRNPELLSFILRDCLTGIQITLF